MMDELIKKMEEDAKNKLWDIALSFGSQVNAKRPFIYWDDVEKVLDTITYLDDDDKILIKQDLEQKVYLVMKEGKENE